MKLSERKWPDVAPILLAANGGTDGLVQLPNAIGLFTGQIVVLQQGSVSKNYKIKKFKDNNSFWVGDPGMNINARSDISAFTTAGSAFIYATEQDRVNIPEDDQDRATYAEEPIIARRVISVDENGDYYNETNRVPVDAQVTVVVPPLTVDLDALTPPDQANPDNVLIAGSEDGTKSGNKHAVRVDAELDLRVGISDGANKAVVDAGGDLHVYDAGALAALQSIDAGIPAALGQTTMAGSMPVTIASDQTPIPVEMTFPNEPMKISGTVDGAPNGIEYGFVNNLRLQILDSHDRVAQFTYADFGTKNQRITKIDYTSATFPSATIRREFAYTLVGNNYRRDDETWTVV